MSRPRHKTIKARNLRDGDLMRVRVSTNYVKIVDVTQTPDGHVHATLYNGDVPDTEPRLHFGADEDVSLSTYGMTDAEFGEQR
jgi:hypothetical protein